MQVFSKSAEIWVVLDSELTLVVTLGEKTGARAHQQTSALLKVRLGENQTEWVRRSGNVLCCLGDFQSTQFIHFAGALGRQFVLKFLLVLVFVWLFRSRVEKPLAVLKASLSQA